METVISEMGEEDRSAVMGLLNAHFPYVQMDEEKMDGRLGKGSRFFVAKARNQVVGFIELQKNGFVRGIAVDDNWRGKGIGTSLLEQAISESLKSGISSVRLKVRIDNIPAIRVYERYGFAIKKQIVNKKGEQVYLMEMGASN